MIETLTVEGWPAPIGPFSMGKKAGGFLFLSGQTGTGEDGGIVPGGVVAEAEAIMKRLEQLLKAAGASFDDVIDVNCFLTDMNDFNAFNQVYAKYFTSKPARTCVAVKALPLGATCEVRATVYLGE